ncbi:hypothetical protein FHR84_003818 [Actinopolyspora biskrensis]|uniref:Uncharacterized protein n=1 Tax=Actinopolyspora biskrensis TaxID=1470178 RepID=A0A852Z0X0_9ACTN|nr:hypothetical protein [Actinopolyspora biskrensis]
MGRSSSPGATAAGREVRIFLRRRPLTTTSALAPPNSHWNLQQKGSVQRRRSEPGQDEKLRRVSRMHRQAGPPAA